MSNFTRMALAAEGIFPPPRPQSADTWSAPSGCWADVWDEGRQEYRPCELEPDPASELGLCTAHETKLASTRS